MKIYPELVEGKGRISTKRCKVYEYNTELPLQMSASMTKAIPNTRQMLDIISSVIKDKYIPAEQTSLFYTPIDGSLKQILTP